jgi:hypothetical protein
VRDFVRRVKIAAAQAAEHLGLGRAAVGEGDGAQAGAAGVGHEHGPAASVAGGRWNQVKGDFSGQENLTVTRSALSAGWFLTRNLMTKAEWVQQAFGGFAATDIRNGGKFHGIAIEGVIAF